MNWKTIVWNGLKTSAALTVTTTIAIIAASAIENKAPWAAINAISHVVEGDDSLPTEFSPRHTAIGLVVNTSAMVIWGMLYEGALAASRHCSTPLTAAATTAGAYAADYHVVPKRFTPGIEKRLSLTGVLACYGVLAATLACSSFWNNYDHHPDK